MENDKIDDDIEKNIEQSEEKEISKNEEQVEKSENQGNEVTADTSQTPAEEIEEKIKEEVNDLNDQKNDVEGLAKNVDETTPLNTNFDEKAKDNETEKTLNVKEDKLNPIERDDMVTVDDALYRSMSMDIQEFAQGQELLNELFFQKESIEVELETEDLIMVELSRLQSEKTSPVQVVDRSEIIIKLKEALVDRKSLIDSNRHFQSQLVEHFKYIKAKQKLSNKPISGKDTLIDFNIQYERYMEILGQLVREQDSEQSRYQEKLEKIKTASEIKIEQNNDCSKEFNKYQEVIGLSTIHSRTGFKLGADVIKDFFSMESKKEAIIKEERLSNLKLEHKNARFDKSLRSKENFQGGLRLIDFEQLKIENQTFNEKVEERREAINKLYRKITNCNHLLSHIKEKLSFTEADKKQSALKLGVLSKEFKKFQIINNKCKKVRDFIKSNNKSLQMSCGLLGNKDYLKKYEEIHDKVGKMTESIDKMQTTMKNAAVATKNLINNIESKRNNEE